jgi:hypothetical protein
MIYTRSVEIPALASGVTWTRGPRLNLLSLADNGDSSEPLNVLI